MMPRICGLFDLIPEKTKELNCLVTRHVVVFGTVRNHQHLEEALLLQFITKKCRVRSSRWPTWHAAAIRLVRTMR